MAAVAGTAAIANDANANLLFRPYKAVLLIKRGKMRDGFPLGSLGGLSGA